MIFFFLSWSRSAQRLQKVGMSRGCWILLWLIIYDCQRRSREIMHVWSKKPPLPATHTHTHTHAHTLWKYQLVWWVAPGQMFCPLLDLSRGWHLVFFCYILSFSWLFFSPHKHTPSRTPLADAVTSSPAVVLAAAAVAAAESLNPFWWINISKMSRCNHGDPVTPLNML